MNRENRNTLLEFSIVFLVIGVLMLISSHLIIGGLICGAVFVSLAGYIVYALHKRKELRISFN